MKTVGEMLQEARQSKHLTLEDIEEGTKIRLKFLRAIEANDFSTMPSLSYAKGFVKNYGEYLGMDSRVVLAFFRRQIADAPRSSLLPKGMEKPLNRSLIQLTPGRFIGLIVVVCVVLFLAYFVLQYRTLNQPPILTIDQPTNQKVVSDSRVEIFGKTDPDATVTINGVSVLVRGDGKFFDQVGLDSGVNTIVITATSRFGKSSTVTREVGYTAQENH
ncbi:MAG TPA: helix-turn-helix domain-containing protein [Patescibacteria group bacterium]|jgi:cytoskeletal protein RodZ|nr:helix-turn-helix domain-containing protein [Patescibacteria group bacterium]